MFNVWRVWLSFIGIPKTEIYTIHAGKKSHILIFPIPITVPIEVQSDLGER